VVVTWAFVADGAADSFFIENTDEALRRAEAGQAEAGVAALVLLVLGACAMRLASRFRRAAAWLVTGAAAVVLLTSQSEAVLVTGLLSALPVGLGALLGVVPAASPTDQ
jgi:hypothetical protein